MANVGWIKIHRSINEWGWKTDPNVTALWFHLLLTANYEDAIFLGHHIKEGSLATGLNSLSERTGLSVQQVRTAINKLKSTNEITIKTNTKFSIISITKWNHYQDNNTPINKPITNEQQTNNKPITTIKETKKLRSKEEKNIDIQDLLFPDCIPKTEWKMYKEYRGKKFTENAQKLAIRKLEAWNKEGYDIKSILETSVMNGWSGLFLPKDAPKVKKPWSAF